MITSHLLSIQVGLPKTRGSDDAVDPMDEQWTSAIFKQPIAGQVWLGKENLVGDAQADRKNHGGPHRPVLAYAAAHYPLWQAELGLSEIPYGGFGENFTIDGLTEEAVCIGDTYTVGAVVVQVSQPRTPCWKIERRWRLPGLLQKVRDTGRTGWYLRVLTEGYVEAGQTVELVERPYPDWNITYVAHLLANGEADPDAQAQLAACEALTPDLRAYFRRRARKKV